ncbi:unnamed protein product [Bathycoccus prasinos]
MSPRFYQTELSHWRPDQRNPLFPEKVGLRRCKNQHRLRRGLPGYLILFAPRAFAPQCQECTRKLPSH